MSNRGTHESEVVVDPAIKATGTPTVSERLGALERNTKGIGGGWKWYGRLSPILIPLVVVLFQYIIIDLPSRVASPQFEVEQYMTTGGAGKTQYQVIIRVTNPGYRTLDAGRAFIFLRFLAPIVSTPDVNSLSPGTTFKNESGNDVDSCIGISACKVILGSIAGQRQVTILLPFTSERDLDTAPVLNHEGREIRPYACNNLRDGICPHLPPQFET